MGETEKGEKETYFYWKGFWSVNIGFPSQRIL